MAQTEIRIAFKKWIFTKAILIIQKKIYREILKSDDY